LVREDDDWLGVGLEVGGEPQPQLQRLAVVLGERFTNGLAVAACVKPGLHRHR